MNIADLREKRNKAEADALAIRAAGQFTSETRATFDAYIAEAKQCDEDIQRLEDLESREAAQRSRQANRPDPGAATDRKQEIRSAYTAFAKVGLQNMPAEQRDLLTINANGQALIAQAFDNELVEAQKAWGDLYNIIDVKETDGGNPMKISLVNDTANMLTMSTPAEGGTGTEVDPSTNSFILSVDELQTIVRISLAELTDSAFDLAEWIKGAFGKRYFRGLAQYFALGNGSNIAGVIAGYSSNALTMNTTGVIGYADIVKTAAALDPAYQGNASWVMNTNTKFQLIGDVDSLGRPLFTPDPQTGELNRLLGRPVVISQSHPSVATGNTAVQYGDFKAGYRGRVVKPGLAVIRLNERYMDQREVGFVGFARAGGAVTDAGTHPIVNLVGK